MTTQTQTVPPLSQSKQGLMPCAFLYLERVIRSVANNTRQDGEDFLKIAAEIPIHIEVQEFPLAEANAALNSLKHDAVRGAAVLRV